MNKLIECIDLRKEYRDGSRVLRILNGVNLDVHEGEALAICGPSGAGKSTLLHLMGALDAPTAGQIRFRGTPYASMGRAAMNTLRNRHLGFVFQFYHLLPEFTALENVIMPALATGARRNACRERGEELLTKVGLAERMTHKPGELSGGEQQRVAIARALFNKPSLLLADEPTGNLDEATSGEVENLLLDLNRSENVTLVLVTHNLALARRAHRLLTLHEGRIQL
jgi:lipoprotein-releasing system ATP-binding protein